MKKHKNKVCRILMLSALFISCSEKEEIREEGGQMPDPVAIHLAVSDAGSPAVVVRAGGYVQETYAGTSPMELTLHPAESFLPANHPFYETFKDQDLNADYHYRLTATREDEKSDWLFTGHQIDKDGNDTGAAVDNKPDATNPDKELVPPYWASLRAVYTVSATIGYCTDFPPIDASGKTDVSAENNPFLYQNTPSGYANANFMKFDSSNFIPNDHLSTQGDKTSPVAIGPFTNHLLSQLHVFIKLHSKLVKEGYTYQLAILGTTNRYSLRGGGVSKSVTAPIEVRHCDTHSPSLRYPQSVTAIQTLDAVTETVTPGIRTTGQASFPAHYDATTNPDGDLLKDVECIRALHVATDQASHTLEFAAIVVPGQAEIAAGAFLVLTLSRNANDVSYLIYSLTTALPADTFVANRSHKMQIDLSNAVVDPNPGVRSTSQGQPRMITTQGTAHIEKGDWK